MKIHVHTEQTLTKRKCHRNCWWFWTDRRRISGVTAAADDAAAIKPAWWYWAKPLRWH